MQTYDSPIYGGFIEVDHNKHVWLVGEADPWSIRALWRMSPRPDFYLSTAPATWFIKPDDSRQFAVAVVPVEDYTKQMQLSVSGLPASVTADLQPDKVVAGQTAVLSLTTNAAALGKTTIKISGVSGGITRSQTVTLAVVEQAHKINLPAIYQQVAVGRWLLTIGHWLLAIGY